MFFCWNAYLLMSKVWQVCWRLPTTSTSWSLPCRAILNSSFPWRTLTLGCKVSFVPFLGHCHHCGGVGNWMRLSLILVPLLCFSPLFHCEFTMYVHLTLFHCFISHPFGWRCIIVPLFHLFHCSMCCTVHCLCTHIHDRWTHWSDPYMPWTVRTKPWVCGCKPWANFSGYSWWMKPMIWKSTKSWAKQKSSMRRPLIWYMHSEAKQRFFISECANRAKFCPLQATFLCYDVKPVPIKYGKFSTWSIKSGLLLRTVFDLGSHFIFF